MFYYFIEGSNDVFEREEEVNLEDYPQFTLLNSEELEYYLAHPGSNRMEIMRGLIEDNIPEPTVYSVKEDKKREIRDYDSSDNVNGFFIGGNVMWLSPSVRDNYMNTLQGAQRLGVETVSFMGYDIAPADGITMLDMINLYAMQCVGVTDYHLSNIDNFQTIDEIENYDHTVGYPERLRFFEPSEIEEEAEEIDSNENGDEEINP